MTTWYLLAIELIGHTSILIFVYSIFWYFYNLKKALNLTKFKQVNLFWFVLTMIFLFVQLILIIVWILFVSNPILFVNDELSTTNSIVIYILLAMFTFIWSLLMTLYLLLFEKQFVIYENENKLYSFGKEIPNLILIKSYKKFCYFKIGKFDHCFIRKNNPFCELLIKYSKIIEK